MIFIFFFPKLYIYLRCSNMAIIYLSLYQALCSLTNLIGESVAFSFHFPIPETCLNLCALFGSSVRGIYYSPHPPFCLSSLCAGGGLKRDMPMNPSTPLFITNLLVNEISGVTWSYNFGNFPFWQLIMKLNQKKEKAKTLSSHA